MGKYSDYVKEYVRLRLGLKRDDTSKDDYIDRMSRNEVFASVLAWEGIIGYDLMIRNLIEDIYQVSLSEEPIIHESHTPKQSNELEDKNVGSRKTNPFNGINSSIVADSDNQDTTGEVRRNRRLMPASKMTKAVEIHKAGEEASKNYSKEQLDIIKRCERLGYDSRSLRESGLTIEQLAERFNKLKERRIALYRDRGDFNPEQLRVITLCIMQELDISYLADADFSVEQMNLIHDGLIRGLDVSMYANPKLDIYAMEAVRQSLLKQSRLNQSKDCSNKVCEVCGDCPKFSEHDTDKLKDTQIKKGHCDKWNQDGLFADTKACSYANGKTVEELRWKS